MLGNDGDLIQKLPDGILMEHVFPRISGEICSFVCRRWRELERSRRELSIVWKPSVGLVKHHNVKAGPMAYLPRLAENFPVLVHLQWREEETGRFGFLDPEGLRTVSRGFAQLETLRLTDCVAVDDEAIAQLAANCTNLRALRLENCPNVGESGLEAVALQFQAPPGGVPGAPGPPGGAHPAPPAPAVPPPRQWPMRVLQIVQCPKFDEKALRSLLLAWGRTLRTLHVAQCGPPSDAWLSSIGSLCPRLENLWLGKFGGRRDEHELAVGGNNFGQLGLHQQLAQLWAQFQAQAQAALAQGLNPPLAPPLPVALLWHAPVGPRGKFFSNAGVESLAESRAGSRLKSLTLHPCGEVTAAGLAALARGCLSLRDLDLGRGLWDQEGLEGALHLLGGSCRGLCQLALSGRGKRGPAPLSAAELALVTGAVPALASLSLGCFRLGGSSHREWSMAFAACGPRLTSLRLWELDGADDGVLTAVGLNCPNLVELWVDCQPPGATPGPRNRRLGSHLTEEAMASLATGCRRLRTLRLAGLDGILDPSFARLVAASGPSLRSLDFDDCAGVGPETLVTIAHSCRNLESLRLARRVPLSDALLAGILARCRKLATLALWRCPQLTNGGLVAAFQAMSPGRRRLEALSLTACPGVTEEGVEGLLGLGFKAPKLLELNEQNVMLDVRLYVKAEAAGCTISNLCCASRGSVASDMEDPDWRTRELEPAWLAARET